MIYLKDLTPIHLTQFLSDFIATDYVHLPLILLHVLRLFPVAVRLYSRRHHSHKLPFHYYYYYHYRYPCHYLYCPLVSLYFLLHTRLAHYKDSTSSQHHD
jgi:hypothetical protein